MWLRRNEGKKTSPFWYGLNYLKKYKLKLFAAVFVSVCYALIPMQIPVITGFLVDGLTMSGNINQSILYDYFRYFHHGPNFFTTPEDILYFALISLLIVAFLYGVTAYFRVYLRSSISRNFMFELQRAMVQKLEFLSLAIHKKYGSGNILNHIIIDSNNVRPFVETTIIKTTTNIVRISYPLVILFIIDPILALIAYSVLPPLFFTIKLMQSSLGNILKRQRNDRSRLVTLLKENLDNIETIQSSAAEQRSIENISKRIQTIETAQIKSQHIYALMIGAAWSLTALGIAVTWWYGGHQVLRNDITLGQLVTFTGFLLFAYEPVRYFTKSIRDYRRSIIALKHIQDLLELPSSVDENSDLKPLNVTNGSIQLQNIFFSMGDVNNPKLQTKDLSILTPIHYTKDKYTRYTLKDISLKIEPKAITAIVGKSGSGKSSILRLMMRLYDPNAGRVLIDNQDIKFVSLLSLREQIALVPQTPAVFSGTIMENICLSRPDASKLEVKEICNSIDASSFIKKFDKGLDTTVGQGGIHLSAGEIQKIALARALLKRPKILLLDEPISSVDPDSAKLIRSRLLEFKNTMTIVIIDHSPNSVNFVDNIFTIHNGMLRDSTRMKAVKEFENGSYITYSKENLAYELVEKSDNINSKKQKFLGVLRSSPMANVMSANRPVEFKIIGKSTENRRMDVVFIGDSINPKLKVFILAGQHGDEKGSRRAAEILISHLIKSNEFSDICVAVLSNANPDGGHRKQRKASKIDLNRDHLLLSSSENRVIHSFVQSWKPNVILDLHNYPPSREYLNESNHAFYHDVLLDGPTNPSGINGFDNIQLDNLIKHVQTDLSELNYECARYVLIYPEGRARHSTNDIVDLRNFMSVRHNILAILVEGKEPLQGSDYDAQLQRTVSAQYHAVLSILKWIIENKPILNGDHIHKYTKGERYSIRQKYVKSDKPFTMNFLNTISNKIEEVSIPSYYPSTVTSRFVRIPTAYGIPVSMKKVIDLLHTHGFASIKVDGKESYKIQEYLILSCDASLAKTKTKPPTNVRIVAFRDERSLEGYEIFPIGQEGGHSLLLLIEPQSEFGFARYEDLGLEIRPGIFFPILRVTDDRFKND